MSTNTKEKQNRRLAASSPPATGGRARSLRESLGGWVAGSGRLQGRGGGAAHLVAEEAGEAALGRGGARRREPAHVPEAQRAIVRGRVQHLAVHLRTRGVGLSATTTPPPARARHSRCPCSYEINHAQALLCSQRRLCMPGHRRERQLPRPTDGGGQGGRGETAQPRGPRLQAGNSACGGVLGAWGPASRPSLPPSAPTASGTGGCIPAQPSSRGAQGTASESAYLDAVNDKGVAAEHPLQRSGLGVEGARAGVPAAGEHCGHTRHWASRPRALHVSRTPQGRGRAGRFTWTLSRPHPPALQGCH